MSNTLLENITEVSADSSFSYGPRRKGAGYNKRQFPVHTLDYDLDNFVGIIKLQATLQLDPAEVDWFDIDDTTISNDSSQVTSFVGNFVWIRAAYNLQSGVIQSVNYNY
jgi:hypothetical protein